MQPNTTSILAMIAAASAMEAAIHLLEKHYDEPESRQLAIEVLTKAARVLRLATPEPTVLKMNSVALAALKIAYVVAVKDGRDTLSFQGETLPTDAVQQMIEAIENQMQKDKEE